MVSIAPGVPPCPPILGEPNAFSPTVGGQGGRLSSYLTRSITPLARRCGERLKSRLVGMTTGPFLRGHVPAARPFDGALPAGKTGVALVGGQARFEVSDSFGQGR